MYLGDLPRTERSQSGSVFGAFIDESMSESVVFLALLSMLLIKGAVETALAEGKAGLLLDSVFHAAWRKLLRSRRRYDSLSQLNHIVAVLK